MRFEPFISGTLVTMSELSDFRDLVLSVLKITFKNQNLKK